MNNVQTTLNQHSLAGLLPVTAEQNRLSSPLAPLPFALLRPFEGKRQKQKYQNTLGLLRPSTQAEPGWRLIYTLYADNIKGAN